MRYPWAPVERLFETDQQAAELIGTTRRNIQRYRANGLSLKQAERIADAVGEHPFVLWPDMRDAVVGAEEERRRALQRASWQRRWERMTEEEREAKRAYTRAYRQKARRAIAAKRRRYYQEHREQELARQRAYDARRRAQGEEVA